jgi:hypothetical protein
VELRRDVAGLLLHEGRVLGPRLQEALGVFCCDIEDVDQHDWTGVLLELLSEHHSFIQLF